MKKIISFILLLILVEISFSQSITPLRTDEFCPGVNITFTVTIAANSITSVVPKALNTNPIVVQQPFNITSNGSNKTFNFVGKFSDYNNKQTFTINYTNTSGQAATFDFTFPKIKSLLFSNSFSQIKPNLSSIIAQICQIQNFVISFPNVQYGNPYESPPIGYGTVINYEYLLPVNWKLNGTTSTGAWLQANNNVTITSDLGTGNGTNIQIRPINTICAVGLQAGQISYIAINRPVSLTITGDKTMCTPTSTYTLGGLPNGSNVSWSSNNPYTASVPNGSSGTSVVLTKVSDGVITLTATVTLCGGQVVTKDYQVAVGNYAFGTYSFSSNCCAGTSALGANNNHLVPKNQSICFSPTISNTDFTSGTWSIISGTQVSYYSNGLSLSFCTYSPSTSYTSKSTTFNFNANGPCGNFNQAFTFTVVANGAFRIIATPNPAKDNLYVSLENDEKSTLQLLDNEIITMNIYDIIKGSKVKCYTYKGTQKQYGMNLLGLKSGAYILEVIIGKDRETTKIFISESKSINFQN